MCSSGRRSAERTRRVVVLLLSPLDALRANARWSSISISNNEGRAALAALTRAEPKGWPQNTSKRTTSAGVGCFASVRSALSGRLRLGISAVMRVSVAVPRAAPRSRDWIDLRSSSSKMTDSAALRASVHQRSSTAIWLAAHRRTECSRLAGVAGPSAPTWPSALSSRRRAARLPARASRSRSPLESRWVRRPLALVLMSPK
jgi:hypothetical protein